MCIFLYADDIILLSPSVAGLQEMIHLCETFLHYIDMALNAMVCLRFGPRFNNVCCSIYTLSGDTLTWVDSCRYLGVFLVAAPGTIIKSLSIECLMESMAKSDAVLRRKSSLNLLILNVFQICFMAWTRVHFWLVTVVLLTLL